MLQLHNANMTEFNGTVLRLFLGEDIVEDVTCIVIAHGEMQVETGVAQWCDELCKVLVVATLSIFEGEVSIDDDGSRALR